MRIYYESNVIKIREDIIYPGMWIDIGPVKGYIKTIRTCGKYPNPTDRVIVDNSTPCNGSTLEVPMEDFVKLYEETHGYTGIIHYTPMKHSFVVVRKF